MRGFCPAWSCTTFNACAHRILAEELDRWLPSSGLLEQALARLE
jgi:hypothetical protein